MKFPSLYVGSSIDAIFATVIAYLIKSIHTCMPIDCTVSNV